MTEHYRAKVMIEDSKLVFEINEDVDVYDAEVFARESAKSWLASHGDKISDNQVEIRLKGESYTLLN